MSIAPSSKELGVPGGREVWTDNSEFSDSRGKLVNSQGKSGGPLDPEGKFTPRTEIVGDSMGGGGLKDYARKFSAEFLGTFMLVLIGDGSIAQLSMKRATVDGVTEGSDFLNVALGYGLGLMVGILVSGGVSGGHLNPAVTLAMASLKKCKWICIPIYWAAQYLGALLAAAILYGIYADGINARLDGPNLGSAGIFASYPNPAASTVTLVFDQALGTAVLLIIILAVTDGKNMKVASGMVPLLIGLGLAVIHISFAFNAGCAINPARDFSPRLLTLMAGFGPETFSAANSFFWIPWIMPHIGGVVGALVYYFLIEWHHPDSEDM